jgi:hypothetical protein
MATSEVGTVESGVPLPASLGPSVVLVLVRLGWLVSVVSVGVGEVAVASPATFFPASVVLVLVLVTVLVAVVVVLVLVAMWVVAVIVVGTIFGQPSTSVRTNVIG